MQIMNIGGWSIVAHNNGINVCRNNNFPWMLVRVPLHMNLQGASIRPSFPTTKSCTLAHWTYATCCVLSTPCICLLTLQEIIILHVQIHMKVPSKRRWTQHELLQSWVVQGTVNTLKSCCCIALHTYTMSHHYSVEPLCSANHFNILPFKFHTQCM